jgi:hypothetical protein
MGFAGFFRSTSRKPTPGRNLLGVARVRRLIQLVGAGLGFFLYVWYAAVHFAPRVKRRKAERRRRSY